MTRARARGRLLPLTAIAVAVAVAVAALSFSNPFTTDKLYLAQKLVELFDIDRLPAIEVEDLSYLRLFFSMKTLATMWDLLQQHEGSIEDWGWLREAGVSQTDLYKLSVFYNLAGNLEPPED